MQIKDVDPKGLIRESYRIEGITLPECKTIFFDWSRLSRSEARLFNRSS